MRREVSCSIHQQKFFMWKEHYMNCHICKHNITWTWPFPFPASHTMNYLSTNKTQHWWQDQCYYTPRLSRIFVNIINRACKRLEISEFHKQQSETHLKNLKWNSGLESCIFIEFQDCCPLMPAQEDQRKVRKHKKWTSDTSWWLC